MDFLIVVFGGLLVLSLILSLEGVSNTKLDRKIKGKNVSMPDISLMFGSKKKRK